jgi:uncharacterized protein YggE
MWKSKLLAACAALLLAASAQAAVTVTGTGKVKYTPDVAYLSFGVSHQEKSAAEAWKKNAAAVKKIIKALKEMGIDEKDIQTTDVSVSPVYDSLRYYPENKTPALIGYRATYQLRVTVRKIKDAGEVLDAAVEAGANGVASVSFGCSDPEKLLDQARLAAAAEARKKAKLYAEGSGAGLGLLKDLTEGTVSPGRTYHFELAQGDKAAPMPIAPGEQELTVTVTATYELVHSTKN